jgi:hypothetical protein
LIKEGFEHRGGKIDWQDFFITERKQKIDVDFYLTAKVSFLTAKSVFFWQMLTTKKRPEILLHYYLV